MESSSKNLEKEKWVNFATVQVYIWFVWLKIYELKKATYTSEEKQKKGWTEKRKREREHEKERESLHIEYTD
jgi:hypothetical protein